MRIPARAAVSAAAVLVAGALLGAPVAHASYLDLEGRIVEHVYDKGPVGLRLIVVPRHDAPVFSYATRVFVGGVNEPAGETGVAHVFEHMAFKGTREIGTSNYAKEKKALEKLDAAFEALRAERGKGEAADAAELASLEKAFEDAKTEAESWIVSDEFTEILERQGGQGVNAGTNYDATTYLYSMPSNKLELWARLEGDRMSHPVIREFWKEKDVIKEERRMRTESNPIGRLIEEFIGVAYLGHPYGRPLVGHMSDIENLSRREAMAFHQEYYVTGNTTIALVGDVDPDEAIALVGRYFKDMPQGPPSPRVSTLEPAQRGERRVTIPDNAQPLVLIGYHSVEGDDPEAAVYDVISDLLAGGRSSRMYEDLVKQKKIAIQVGAFNGFPGDVYPGLFLFYAFPSPGHTAEEVEGEMLALVDRLKKEPPTPEELAGVKTRSRAGFIRGLRSNLGLANQLAWYQQVFGDWRQLFHAVDRIEGVTADDVTDVAKRVFRQENRSVGLTVPQES